MEGDNNVETIILPDSVKTIETRAFESNKVLKHIILKSRYKKIILNSESFSGCYNLETIYISSDTSIVGERNCFYQCPSIKNIILNSKNIKLDRDFTERVDNTTLYILNSSKKISNIKKISTGLNIKCIELN